MFDFELTCLAEQYGTTFECEIEDAELIFVRVEYSQRASGKYNDLDDLHQYVSSLGKAVHVIARSGEVLGQDFATDGAQRHRRVGLDNKGLTPAAERKSTGYVTHVSR